MSLNPGALYLMASRLPFELGALAAELRQQPGENLIRVRSPHMDVVQSEQFRILHDFDARAPGVFHKAELEEPRHVCAPA